MVLDSFNIAQSTVIFLSALVPCIPTVRLNRITFDYPYRLLWANISDKLDSFGWAEGVTCIQDWMQVGPLLDELEKEEAIGCFTGLLSGVKEAFVFIYSVQMERMKGF